VLWEIFLTDEQFGRNVIEQRQDPASVPLSAVLTETELAQLFRWLIVRYPYIQEEIQAGPVTSSFVASRFRDEIFDRLVSFGTYEAINMLESLREDLPTFPWAHYLTKADVRARELTWAPPTPREVVSLAKRSAARFVTNAAQLQEVVLEALRLIQLRIRAETPALSELWNYTPGRNRKYAPKDENDLCDWLKRRLEDTIVATGIIIGREVVIRRNIASSGERTDIYVAATNPRTGEKLVVVLEVKGCWNQGIKEAMATQLIGRYLRENVYTHGVYVIGWFVSSRWDGQFDYRRDAVPFASLGEAREFFAEQAERLSGAQAQVVSFILDASLL
jgi:hypothetical protein